MKLTESTVEDATLSLLGVRCYAALLHKLLSGEIRVKDAKKFVGSAV